MRKEIRKNAGGLQKRLRGPVLHQGIETKCGEDFGRKGPAKEREKRGGRKLVTSQKKKKKILWVAADKGKKNEEQAFSEVEPKTQKTKERA